MLSNPNINEIMPKVGNRYESAIALAKRARKIAKNRLEEETEYKVRSIRPCGRYIFSQLDIKDYCFPGYYCRANELQEAQVSCVVNCDRDILVKLLAEYREPDDWKNKICSFIKAKFGGKKYDRSF